MWARVREWGNLLQRGFHGCNRLDRVTRDAKEEMDQRPGIEVEA